LTSNLWPLRLGEEKKKKIEEEYRKKLQGKNIMALLLHRPAIMTMMSGSKRPAGPIAKEK